MQTLDALLARIQSTPDCALTEGLGLPSVQAGHKVPEDVAHFYSVCGGAKLFSNSAYPYFILPPAQVVPANPVILDEPYSLEQSSSWYLLAHDGNGDYLLIDFAPPRCGRCYDGFHETYGIAGQTPAIAKSFTDLLAGLLANAGAYPFWLESQWVSLGDAYEPQL